MKKNSKRKRILIILTGLILIIAIVDDIIEQQKVTVDSITSATISSIVIKDAVQKALKNGL